MMFLKYLINYVSFISILTDIMLSPSISAVRVGAVGGQIDAASFCNVELVLFLLTRF
jgi:hypothetical protein